MFLDRLVWNFNHQTWMSEANLEFQVRAPGHKEKSLVSTQTSTLYTYLMSNLIIANLIILLFSADVYQIKTTILFNM